MAPSTVLATRCGLLETRAKYKNASITSHIAQSVILGLATQ